MDENKLPTFMTQLEEAIAALSNCMDEDKTEKTLDILESIRIAMNREEVFIVPAELLQAPADLIDSENVKVGDVIEPKDMHFKILSLQLDDGRIVHAAFTRQKFDDRRSAARYTGRYRDDSS